MGDRRKFEDRDGIYTLVLEESKVILDCYLMGSVTGGTGTECSHTIDTEKLSEFLAEMGIENLSELLDLVSNYKSQGWSDLHSIIMKHQTDVFVWSETDWSD